MYFLDLKIYVIADFWTLTFLSENSSSSLITNHLCNNTHYWDSSLQLLENFYTLQEGDNIFPQDENKKVIGSDASYMDTWKEMEKLVEQGLVKSIGISNFNSKQVDDILSIAKIKPVTNQVSIFRVSIYLPPIFDNYISNL